MPPELSVSLENDIEPLAAEWDELADRCAPAPFMRSGWISAWWRAFGAGTLEVLCARDAGRLVGLLPIRRRGRVISSPTNFHTPEFALLTDRSDARRALSEALFALHPRRLSVGFLDGERADAAELKRAAQAVGSRVVVRTSMRSPYVVVDSDWATYERALRRPLLSDLRRCRRRLEEEGDVSIEFSDSAERLDDLLHEMFAVEARSWKADTKSAIVSHQTTQGFYEQISHWAAGRGALRVAMLRVDDLPIAMQLAVEEAGAHFAIKSSYDATYRRFSPGKLLLHAIVERAFMRRLSSVELLGAEDDYKRQWASHSRDRLALQAYAVSPIGWLQWTAEVHGRPMARRAHLTRVRRKLRRLG